MAQHGMADGAWKALRFESPPPQGPDGDLARDADERVVAGLRRKLDIGVSVSKVRRPPPSGAMGTAAEWDDLRVERMGGLRG
eukprot:gene38981-39992_t